MSIDATDRRIVAATQGGLPLVPAPYAALGQVLDRAGQIESAAQCYRNALRLEQGRAPEPLPRPVNTGAA